MKKIFTTFAVAFSAVFFGTLSFATPSSQTITPRQIRETVQERIEKSQEVRQQVRERVEEDKATQAAKIAQIRAKRIRAFFDRLKQRIEAVYERLNTLIVRIEKRVEKLKEEGENTLEIESQIGEAKRLLDEIPSLLEEAETAMEATVGSEDPKEMFKLVIDSIHEIKSNLTKIHTILVHVIGDLKGLHRTKV